MKKILSLLGAIALVGSAGTTVVACGPKLAKITGIYANLALELANKIKNKDVVLRAGTNPDTYYQDTYDAILTTVAKNNGLNYDEMENIFIDQANLKDNEQANTVKANIQIKDYKASVNLNIEIHATAAQIKKKINHAWRFSATFVSTDKTLTSKNAGLIVDKVKANNPQLSAYDLNQLSMVPDSHKTFITEGKIYFVGLKIKDDAFYSKPVIERIEACRFSSSTNQCKADQIRDKIGSQLVVSIPAGSSTTLSDSDTAFKTALKKVNPALNADDLKAIKLIGGTFTLTGGEVNNSVNVKIIVGSSSSKGTAILLLNKVRIHRTADQIKTKITEAGRLTATFVSNVTDLTGVNPGLILDKVKANNPQLSTWDKTQLSMDDKSSISFSKEGIKANVTLKIKDDASKPGSATTTIEARRFATNNDQFNVDHISDKIGPSLVVATPAGTSTNFYRAFDAIEQALIKANPALTLNNFKKMDIEMPSGSIALNGEETPNVLTDTIKDGTVQTKVMLTNVIIHRTANEIKTLITNITNKDINIKGPAGTTGKGTIDAQIKTALQTEAPKLTTWDLSQISIMYGTRLDNKGYTAVKINIKDDASPTAGFATTSVIKFKTAS